MCQKRSLLLSPPRDRSRRSKHGALLDAELLAAVCVEMTTTRQAALQLDPIAVAPSNIQTLIRARRYPLPPRVTADDRSAHRAFVRTLGSEAIWLDYFAARRVAA
jgi:DNA polymerase-3 subunit epsilon